MGKMFSGLKVDNSVEKTDRLGGGRQALPSDAYLATIKVAYVSKSQGSEAQAVNFVLTTEQDPETEHRLQVWISNKAGETFTVDDKTKKKKNLSGYEVVDDICLFVTEQPLTEQDTEIKSVKVYNFEEKKEVPTEVPVLVGLLGGKVRLGIIRKVEFKQKKNDAGGYSNTEDKRTTNEIVKAFHPETNRTISEYEHGVETPEFYEAWIKVNKDRDNDRTANGKSGGGAAGQSGSGRPGAAAGGGAGAGTGTARKKLFG